MSVFGSPGDDRRRAEASDWLVRLQATDLAESDLLAFDAWAGNADNARAYDGAIALEQEYRTNAAGVIRGLSERRAARPARRGLFVGVGAAAAAAAAAAVVLPQLSAGPEVTAYATARGEHQTVKLSDGTTMELDGGTRLTVSMDRHVRHVRLDEGQAVFDVTHDVRRPFEVAVGDRTVRDVGTQFDVRRRDGKLSVTVAEGAVEVRPSAGSIGAAYRLHPGQRLDHLEGEARADVTTVEASEVMGWRAGRLVYRGQPLGEVVADLNQQFPTPIRIEDPALAATPISGVLVLDSQDAVIRRLALLAPLSAVPSEAGLVLRREGASGR